MTNYRGNFLYGFIACGPYEVLPEWVFDKVFCPAVETDPVTGEAPRVTFYAAPEVHYTVGDSLPQNPKTPCADLSTILKYKLENNKE